MSFSEFKLWYAKSLTANTFAGADVGMKIQDIENADAGIELLSCVPSSFQKRRTDVSQALSLDKTSPDTGTAQQDITIEFVQARNVVLTDPVVQKLINMFHVKSNDNMFRKGRFGLENTDTPEIDCLPSVNAGYKFDGFQQVPIHNNPALLHFRIMLQFVGDHTQLGSRV